MRFLEIVLPGHSVGAIETLASDRLPWAKQFSSAGRQLTFCNLVLASAGVGTAPFTGVMLDHSSTECLGRQFSKIPGTLFVRLQVLSLVVPGTGPKRCSIHVSPLMMRVMPAYSQRNRSEKLTNSFQWARGMPVPFLKHTLQGVEAIA